MEKEKEKEPVVVLIKKEFAIFWIQKDGSIQIRKDGYRTILTYETEKLAEQELEEMSKRDLYKNKFTILPVYTFIPPEKKEK